MSDKFTPNRPSAPQSPSPEKPKLIEVELLRKCRPQFLVNDDGTVTKNADSVKNADGNITYITDEDKKVVLPGVVKMHPDDAQHFLNKRVAIPTGETFKDI